MNKHEACEKFRSFAEAFYIMAEHKMGKTRHGSVLGFVFNCGCCILDSFKKWIREKRDQKTKEDLK